MKSFHVFSIVGVSLALPLVALAQTSGTTMSDGQYCLALSNKYSTYVGASANTSTRGMPGPNIDAQIAIDKCKAGNTAAGIPVLEKALKDAKLDLPPRS